MLKEFVQKRFFTTLIFGSSLLILLIIGIVSYQSTTRWRAYSGRVRNTREILITQEKLLSAMKDAETGQRGFLLTGDSTYLAPYQTALITKDSLLTVMQTLYAVTNRPPATLQRISQLIDQQTDVLRENIRIRSIMGVDAVDREKTNRQKALMDSLRRELYGLEQSQRQSLTAQQRDLLIVSRWVGNTQIIGFTVSIALLIWVFSLLRKQMDHRLNDLQQLEEANERLEHHVRERTEDLNLSVETLNLNNKKLNTMIDELTTTQQELLQEQEKTKKALALLEKENERKTRELEDARNLQISMLPQAPPALDHVDMAMFMKTCAEVGGDYYDYKVDEDGTLTVVIGDATGHGLKAGIVVATVKSYFQTLASQCTAVEMLQRISEGIRNLQIRAMYMGLTVIKIKGHELTVASSGMPPIYLYRHARKQVESILLKGVFLGYDLRIPYRLTSIQLQPGDTLLLMSDGLPELFNASREILDHDRIMAHYRQVAHLSAEGVIREMVELGDTWANGNPNEDDITLVTLKIKQ